MASNDRSQLTPDLVLTGAVQLADEIGIEAFTMRKLAAALGVKPMTIYHHVENKESIIDGMVDMVFSEITPPPAGEDWKTAIRIRCISAREVLNRHPWAPPLDGVPHISRPRNSRPSRCRPRVSPSRRPFARDDSSRLRDRR